MKSKLRFDIGEDNSPIIYFEVEQTDDLRDKIAKRFIEELGYESNWLTIQFLPSDSGVYKGVIIPVSDVEVLKDVIEERIPKKEPVSYHEN